MKSAIEVCVVALAMTCVAGAQTPAKPALQHGASVKMAVAGHAVPMPAADEKGATVVAITADGKVSLGVKVVDVNALSSLSSNTIYLKADARLPYQKLLTVLDALHGQSVVLLTAPVSDIEKGKMVPPYGLKINVGGI